jgi:hypothetical protein
MKSSKILFALTALAIATSSFAGPQTTPATGSVIFAENFDDVSQLGGWVMTNASDVAGQSWFQGNSGVFSAHSGAADSYVAADFSSTRNPVGTVDNWLISPLLTLDHASSLSFFTRTADAGFNDKIEVRFSSGSATDLASFSTVLTTVGGDGTYPANGFQQFVATLPVSGTGRFAFRYTGSAADADYIGIDSVRVAAVPEPSTYAMMGLGLAALALVRRKAKKAA